MSKKAAELYPLEEEVPKRKKKKVECVKEVLAGTRRNEAKRKKNQGKHLRKGKRNKTRRKP